MSKYCQDIALYSLINGVDECCKVNSLEEETLKTWIDALDFDRNPFFINLRKYVRKMIEKLGIENACSILGIPKTIQEILAKENQRLASRNTKKIIIKEHLNKLTNSAISEKHNLPIETVMEIIEMYQFVLGRKRPKIEKKELKMEKDNQDAVKIEIQSESEDLLHANQTKSQ